MKLKPNAKELTPERIPLLVLMEDVPGHNFVIKVKNSDVKLVSADGEDMRSAVTVSYEIENGDYEDRVKELLNESVLKGVAEHEQIDHVDVFCRYIEEKDTIFGEDAVMMTDFVTTLKDGNKMLPRATSIVTIAARLDMVPPIYRDMPACLIKALAEGDDKLVAKLSKRIKMFPSAFGKPDKNANFYAIVRPSNSIEERKLRWHIS